MNEAHDNEPLIRCCPVCGHDLTGEEDIHPQCEEDFSAYLTRRAFDADGEC
jgi:hypothetical protein